MLCCFSPSWVDAKAAYNEQAYSNEVSEYPGQRRTYVKTAGNALAEAPSPVSSNYPSSPQQPAYNSTKQEDELISVTVPNGVIGGQIIHVAHPDGSGRLIRCEVPRGLKPGSLFYVKAPSNSPAMVPPSSSPAVNATPIPPPMVSSSSPPSRRESPIPSALAYPVGGDHVDLTIFPSPPASPTSFPVDDEYPSRYTPGMRPSPISTPMAHDNTSLRLVKVVVPPGTAPGTTIHVQIPGSDRLVAAQVPPNCTEFHVQYDPQESSTPCSSAILNSPDAFHHNRYRSQQPPPPYSPAISDYQQTDKKLLLVQVPRGTTPGSTLHVEVPNEPGRLLSVTVPPNVREFHVSYVPRSYHRPNDDVWGSSVLPIAGGLATGLAGAMLYEHFANE